MQIKAAQARPPCVCVCARARARERERERERGTDLQLGTRHTDTSVTEYLHGKILPCRSPGNDCYAVRAPIREGFLSFGDRGLSCIQFLGLRALSPVQVSEGM